VKKLSNLVIRKNAAGEDTYQFTPSKAMRDHGFKTVSFGTKREQAYEDIQAYNVEWKQIKAQKSKLDAGTQVFAKSQAQTMSWLIQRFENDVTYYRSKEKRTQEEFDLVFQFVKDAGFGDVAVRSFKRKHFRLWHSQLIDSGVSDHKIRKVLKCTRRLFNFALRELEIIEANPLADFGLKKIPSRKIIWNSDEVTAVIAASYDNTKDNKKIYPSVGLAVLISVTTTLPLGDILALKWNQFDGEAFTVQQIKERGKITLYIPLTDEVIHELEVMLKGGVNSTHIICYEGTGRPYANGNQFNKAFRRCRDRAGVSKDVKFQDLRKTGITELAAKSATNAEIVSFSGHAYNSPVLQDYVMMAKETARNARAKMGNYLDNEHQDSAANPLEVRQRLQERLQVLQTEGQHTVKPLSLIEKSGDPGRTRTYNPRLRRPIKS
jgi:integrase